LNGAETSLFEVYEQRRAAVLGLAGVLGMGLCLPDRSVLWQSSLEGTIPASGAEALCLAVKDSLGLCELHKLPGGLCQWTFTDVVVLGVFARGLALCVLCSRDGLLQNGSRLRQVIGLDSDLWEA
jgi:hypothetical protein